MDDIEIGNTYYKSIIDLIPANLYIQKEGGNNQRKRPLKKQDKNNNEPIAKIRKKKQKCIKSTSELITSTENIDDTVSAKIPKIKSENISDLQKKLKEKIAEMQAQRQLTKNGNDNKALRRKKEQQKLKNKQKLLSTPAEHQGLAGQANAENINNNNSKKNGIVNSDGKVVFSKFDFGKTNRSAQVKKKKKVPKNWKNDVLTGGKKDLKTLLEKATANKEEMQKLRKENPTEAEELKLKQSWRKAVAKAEGIKVKDNPDLIKKSINKEKSLKKRSAKKWEERNKTVEEKMHKKQEKRKQNIQQRKDNKKNKKINKRLSKFKVSTPGFG